ncbi:MAG: glycosyltransferase family 2 protein [Gemmataceae bacterium]
MSNLRTDALKQNTPALGAERAANPVRRERLAEQGGDRTAWWDSFLDAGPVDVSVCIVNWNCRDLLRDCLESLLDRPQGVRLEVIVVDNASQDGAADMVTSEFPEVTLIRNGENRGFSRGNNQAARMARGRHLLFLNNDTLVPAGTIKQLVDHAEAHPEIGMIGPLLRGGDGTVQTSWRNRPTVGSLLHRTCLLRWTGLLRRAYRRYRRHDIDMQPREVDVLMGAALFVPRQVYEECGGWDEEFLFGGEDLELCLRVSRTRPLVYLPAVEIVHYGRVSTRAHVGFATTQIMVGFARYLRRSGVSSLSLFMYKLLVTIDAPLQILVKLGEYAWRKLRGREGAAKSLLVVRNLTHFLSRGLVAFWRV